MTAFETRDLGLTDKNAGCACCSPTSHATATASAQTAPEPMGSRPIVTDYLVEGMTCGHCVRSVTEELSELPGVAEVDVDLNSGGLSRVRVASDAVLDEDQVRAAVEEAGYALAPTS
ncbi:heavy-metal-associated domain-containing protein [Microbacterium sp. SS28]|uniref:heavy-metal-associated domain-containing protein n=1 Tax=Microbacterium sp. SS28 TaxID=2919948 RepID=UPI001FA97FC6|nr:cation transporter [Microbacterium sp. SS28]